MSADDLVREYHEFERSVLWRRRREITGALGGLVAGAGLFWRAIDVAPQIGGALSIAVALFITWYLARKTSVEPMPRHSSFSSALILYRREIECQTRLLRRVAWLWSLTIIPPIAAEAIGRALGTAQPFIHPVHVGGYLLICFLIGWLYVQHAQALQRRSETLARIADRS
jgi:hypothetical protein